MKKNDFFSKNPNCQEYSIHWLSHPELTVFGKKILQNLHIQGLLRVWTKEPGERRLYYRDCRTREGVVGGVGVFSPFTQWECCVGGWWHHLHANYWLWLVGWQMVNHHLNNISPLSLLPSLCLPRTEKAGWRERSLIAVPVCGLILISD